MSDEIEAEAGKKYVGQILSASNESGVKWVSMLTSKGIVSFGPSIDPQCYGYLRQMVGLPLNVCVESKQHDPGPGGTVISYGLAD